MTIKEIAKLAGVSISTVSKIINNKDDNINSNTRNRVLEIVKEYNYVPYAYVKTGAESKTFVLGVLLRSAQCPSPFLNGILATAQQHGYSIMLFDSMRDTQIELKLITVLCRNRVDGVIWEPVQESSLEYRRYFEEQNIEICLANCDFDDSSYRIDFTEIGRQATQALLEYGHKKPGCLTSRDDPTSPSVLTGFKKCLFEHGITYHDYMHIECEAAEWAANLLTHTPSGIVCANFSAAMVLMEQISKIHFQIPHDLSLISLSDKPEQNKYFPKLSCIQIPYLEFGSFLCERLIEKCEKLPSAAAEFPICCRPANDTSLDAPYPSYAKKIVVVGSIHIDITLNVEELPQPGKAICTSKHSIIPGGKGANQAVGVAKLGNEVCLLGKVGNDYDSTLIYACMQENYVDYQGIRRDPYTETGKAYIHVQNDGESMITLLSGANQNLTPADIASYEALFENAGYCLLQTEIPEITIQTAAEIARRYHAKNILKPAAMNHINDSLFNLIDIFVPNKKEAEILCPDITDIPGKADAFLARGAKTVIITLGEDGCYIKSPTFIGYLPAADFTPVDTTGAADAFISALAVYLIAGYPIERAARIASYAAGFCISRQGVIPALIDRNSLETYICQTEPDILSAT